MGMRHGVCAEPHAPLSQKRQPLPTQERQRRNSGIGPPTPVIGTANLTRHDEHRSRQAVLFEQRRHFGAEIDEPIVESERDRVLALRGVLSNSSRLTTRTFPDASHSTCRRNAAGDTEIGEPEESME
jgi:hypothetical protein